VTTPQDYVIMARPGFWFYIDDDKQIQGPFPDQDMLEWYREGYFTLETKVRAALFEDEKAEDPEEFEQIGKRSDFLDAETVQRIKEQQLAELRSRTSATSQTAADTQTGGTEADGSAAAAAPSKKGAADASEVPQNTSTATTGEDLAWRDDDEWYYIDKSGKEQGPFPTPMMRAWFAMGHFNGESMLRPKRSTTSAFAPAKVYQPSPFGLKPSGVCTLAPPQIQAASTTKSSIDEDRMWFYQETVPTGAPSKGGRPRIRGPISTLQMRYWIRKGFFTFDNTPVRREGQPSFTPILQHPDLHVLLSGVSNENELQSVPGRTATEIEALKASLRMSLPGPVTRFEQLPPPLMPLYAPQHMGHANYLQELRNAQIMQYYSYHHHHHHQQQQQQQQQQMSMYDQHFPQQQVQVQSSHQHRRQHYSDYHDHKQHHHQSDRGQPRSSHREHSTSRSREGERRDVDRRR